MRNLILVILLCIILVLGYYAYKLYNEKQELLYWLKANSVGVAFAVEKNKNLKDISLVELFEFFITPRLFSPFNSNTEIISEIKAKKMIQDCVISMIDPNDPIYKNKDSIERSIHFKLGLIIKTLDSLKNSIPNSVYDDFGLRFYFAKYTKDANYGNRYTGVIKLTHKDTNVAGDQVTFNLGGLCPPKCIPTTYEKNDPLFH